MFSRETFLNLVVSTMMSLVMCCIGAANIDAIHNFVSPFVVPLLDQPSRKEAERIKAKIEDEKTVRGSDVAIENHVVILGFNEAGLEVAEHFRELNREVYVIDLDYQLHEVFKFAHKGVKGHKQPRCPDLEDGHTQHAANLKRRSTIFSGNSNAVSPEELNAADQLPTPKMAKGRDHKGQKGEFLFPVDGLQFGHGTNIFSIYEDPESFHTWEAYNLKSASLVVSCMWNRNQASLCQYMKDSRVPLTVTTENNEDSR
jgi:voltage-gated potassium channel Kch